MLAFSKAALLPCLPWGQRSPFLQSRGSTGGHQGCGVRGIPIPAEQRLRWQQSGMCLLANRCGPPQKQCYQTHLICIELHCFHLFYTDTQFKHPLPVVYISQLAMFLKVETFNLLSFLWSRLHTNHTEVTICYSGLSLPKLLRVSFCGLEGKSIF